MCSRTGVDGAMTDSGKSIREGAVGNRAGRQFVRFVFVGLAGFGLDAGLTAGLAAGGFDPRVARVPAIAAAMLFTWGLNRGFTFRSAAPFASLLPYLLVAAMVAGLNYLLFVLLIALGLGPFPAVAGATAVSMLLSFAGYRKLVFHGAGLRWAIDPGGWTPGIVLLLGAVWMAAHPYAGIRHDAVYYALDALFNLDPAPFDRELFFQAGSPYAASLLGPLYARLTDLLGTTTAARTMFIVSQSLWAIAAISWSTRFLPSHRLWPLAPLLFLIPHVYDNDGLLRIAELHFTARSLAEPLSLLGLLAILAGRPLAGWGALVAAALTHPIMALAGWGCGLWLELRLRGWSIRALLSALSIAFVLVALMSTQGLFGILEDDWLALIARRNAFVIPSQWGFEYAARVGAPVLVLLAAARFLPVGLANFYSGVAVVALSGVALTVLGECMRAALIVQAQPWRTAWMAVWAAPFAAASAAWTLWRFDRASSLLFIGAIPAAMLGAYAVLPWVAWLPLLHAVLLSAACIRPRPGRFWKFVALAVLATLGAVLSVVLGAVLYVGLLMEMPQGVIPWRSARELTVDATAWLLAPILLYGLWQLLGPMRRHAAWGRFIALLVFGIALWTGDAREADRLRKERWIDSGLPALRVATADAELIMWPEHVALIWLALRRPGYVSVEQTAPAMFDPGVAREGSRRMGVVGALGGADGVFDHRQALRAGAQGPVADPAAFQRLCADRPTVALVFDRPLSAGAQPVSLDPGTMVWVHRCEPGVSS